MQQLKAVADRYADSIVTLLPLEAVIPDGEQLAALDRTGLPRHNLATAAL